MEAGNTESTRNRSPTNFGFEKDRAVKTNDNLCDEVNMMIKRTQFYLNAAKVPGLLSVPSTAS